MQKQDIPPGCCQCGCGQRTRISDRTCTEKGWVRGVPRAYVNGHNRRIHDFSYDVDAVTGCWVWKGSRTRFGYGQGNFPGYKGVAHIWFYVQANGAVPVGMQLDHLCRNRLCVNPDHLEPVTPLENARRGRKTVLSPEQVRIIKRHPRVRGSQAKLAAQFGVTESAIGAILTGRTWRDVA